MKKIKARIPAGKTVFVQEINLYTKNEARKILACREWEIGEDIYSVEKTNERIGWLASFGNGEGIYIEV